MLVLALLVGAGELGTQGRIDLGPPRQIVQGVALYHVTDASLISPAAPLSIWLLRVDPRLADLRAVLANDAIVDTETVPDIAARTRAVAAINAGFFLLPTGDPSGIYKLDGQLVSDTRRQRGAFGIIRRDGMAPRFIFGRVSATMALRIRRRVRPDVRLEIAGVDTIRRLGRLMLFTPAYHPHTDTAPGGREWIVRGRPLTVADPPRSQGKTPIPADGFVLSFGGQRVPAALEALRPGTAVDLETQYRPVEGRADDWALAAEIVGGAGLLLYNGRVSDWTIENLASGFSETRHPRTMIGTDGAGSLWLVTVDGRQPALSAGMTLGELRDLARRLELVNALNLDGGGSTTMWVGGQVVNSPSDASGPRKVSDALVVRQ